MYKDELFYGGGGGGGGQAKEYYKIILLERGIAYSEILQKISRSCNKLRDLVAN